MATYGGFETVSELVVSGAARVFRARRTGENDAGNFVVKVRVAIDDFTGERDQQAIDDFLKQVELLKKLESSKLWARVYESGTTEDGAYFASDLHATNDGRPQNLDTLCSVRRLAVEERTLTMTVLGVLDGLHAMEDTLRRGHGNLKPQNVLIDDAAPQGAGSEAEERPAFRIVLTDPLASDVGGKTLKDDLPAVAGLIHLMVFNQPLKRTGIVSLREQGEWEAKGINGGFWRTLCSDLLGQGSQAVALDQARKRVKQHAAGLDGKKAKAQVREAVPTAGVADGSKVDGAAAASVASEGNADTWQESDRDGKAQGRGGSGGGGKKYVIIGGAVVISLAGALGIYLVMRGGGAQDKKDPDPTPGGKGSQGSVTAADVKLDDNDKRLRPRFFWLFGQRQDIVAAWKRSEDPTLIKLAGIIDKDLSKGDAWEKALKEPAALSAEERGVVADDRERLITLVKELKHWDVRKQLDEPGKGTARLAGDGQAALKDVLDGLSSSLSGDSAEKYATLYRDALPKLVLDAKAERAIGGIEMEINRLTARVEPRVKDLGSLALEEISKQGKDAASLTALATKLGSQEEWKKTIDALLEAVSRKSSQWDGVAFSTDLEKRWGEIKGEAISRVREVTRLANDARWKALTAAEDPREKWRSNERTEILKVKKALDELSVEAKMKEPQNAAEKGRIEQEISRLTAEIETIEAEPKVLYRHRKDAVDGALAKKQTEIQQVGSDVAKLARGVRVDMAKLLDSLKQAGATSGPLVNDGATAIREAAAKLNAEKDDDRARGDVLRKLLDKLEQASKEIDAAVENGGQRMPGGAWPSTAWKRFVEVRASKKLQDAVRQSVTANSDILDITPVIGDVTDLSAQAAQVKVADEVLRAAVTSPDSVAAKGVLAQDVVDKATALKVQVETLGMKDTTAFDLFGLKEFESFQKLALLGGVKDRAELVDRLSKGTATVAEAVLAVEKLVAADALILSTADYGNLGNAVRRARERADGLKDATQQANTKQRLNELMRLGVEQFFKRAGDDQTKWRESLAAFIDSPAVDEKSLSVWARFALLRFRLQAQLDKAGSDQEKVKGVVQSTITELTGLKQSAKDGLPLAAGVLEQRLSEILANKGPVFSASATPPALKGWTASGDQAGPVIFSLGDAKVAFLPVSVGERTVYISTAEVSLRTVNAIPKEHLDRAALQTELPPKMLDKGTSSRDESLGVTGWIWVDRGVLFGPSVVAAQAKLKPTDDRAKGWFANPGANDGLEIFPSGWTVPSPSDLMPLQQISVPAAVRIAQGMGCRLPTSAEWEAAIKRRTQQSDTGAAVSSLLAMSETRVRDEAWQEWMQFLGKLPNENPNNKKFVVRPKPGNNVSESLPDAEVVKPGNSKTVLFAATNPEANQFEHLVGNVAEMVYSDPATCTVDGVAKPDGLSKAGVIGGSVLSATPAARLGQPLPKLRFSDKTKAFADVGFRLAFEAAGSASLAEQVRKAVDEVKYAAK